MDTLGIGLQAFKAEQSKGINALNFESSVPKEKIENFVSDPKVSPVTKAAVKSTTLDTRGAVQGLNLLKVADAPKEKRPERVSQQKSSSALAENLLSPLSGMFKVQEGNQVTRGKKEPLQKDNIPFKHGTINPSKDKSILNINKFKQDLADKESFGGKYDLASKVSSATGKYQFLWNTWDKDIKNVTGVSSREGFLKNPKAQEKFFDWYYKNKLMPQAKELKDLGASKGFTEEEIAKLVHFRGKGGARKILRKDPSTYDKVDSANNMPINKYLNRGKWASRGKKG